MCGVYQYGLATAMILSKSNKYELDYTELDSLDIFDSLDDEGKTLDDRYEAFIFNYHPVTLGCLDRQTKTFKNKQLVIVGHDYFPHKKFDKLISCDCTMPTTESTAVVGRPILNFPLSDEKIDEVTIGTFGFPFSVKNFEKLVDIATRSFFKFKLRMHFARYPYGDQFDSIINSINTKIEDYNKNGWSISIEVSTDFLSPQELINWLHLNSINVFLYPEHVGYRGLSSVIDYALAADRPIAISNSDMFRHINHEEKFLLDKHSLKDILEFGTSHLDQFKEKWSEKNFILQYEHILDNL